MNKLALALCVVPVLSLAGQTCRDCMSPPEDTVPRTHILPALGIRVGSPHKASIALGAVLGEDWQQDGHDHSRNVALFAEPGLGAGRASLAYIRHGYGSFGSGFALATTILRTWDDPWGARENTTYAGAEVILWPVLFAGPRLGVFRRIAGLGTTRRWMLSLDIGVGL